MSNNYIKTLVLTLCMYVFILNANRTCRLDFVLGYLTQCASTCGRVKLVKEITFKNSIKNCIETHAISKNAQIHGLSRQILSSVVGNSDEQNTYVFKIIKKMFY